jgi:hypothetical protein
MPDLLLTGAGFSRNWGGWLANEVFEYLLGCPEITADILAELWRSKSGGLDFESTLHELRTTAKKLKDRRSEDNVRTFEQMLEGMFNSMNNGFKRIEFNPAFDSLTIGGSPDYIRRFLCHFDAIFTLNQDCLLELKYGPENLRQLSDGRWRDLHLPGIEPLRIGGSLVAAPGLFQPSGTPCQVEASRQPYFKLHGSCNWRDGNSTVLIMGGNKGADIDRHPLLRSYKEHFFRLVCRSDTRLVIIGYSFRDEHINDILGQAAAAGAKFFIIDTRGIDVLSSARDLLTPTTGRSFHDAVFRNVAGASRRELEGTFSTDEVERSKITRFLTRLGPGA